MEIKLGTRVRNIVNGFTGIATSRCEYLNGCIQYCVSPSSLDKDGKVADGHYIDIGQLEIVDEGIIAKKSTPRLVGGPQANTPSTEYRG